MYFGNMESGVYGLLVHNIKNDLCTFLITVVNISVIRNPITRVSEPKISSLGMFMQCNSSTGPLGSNFDVILINYVHVILIADILNQMIEEILNCYSYNLARL